MSSKHFNFSIFAHNFVIALAYNICNSKRAIFFSIALDLNSVIIERTGTSQNITSGHNPLNFMSYWSPFFSK